MIYVIMFDWKGLMRNLKYLRTSKNMNEISFETRRFFFGRFV